MLDYKPDSQEVSKRAKSLPPSREFTLPQITDTDHWHITKSTFHLLDLQDHYVTMSSYELSGLSGPSGPPTVLHYVPQAKIHPSNIATGDNIIPWTDKSSTAVTGSTTKKRHEKASKKRSKHRSKSHKKEPKDRMGAYILQLIGLICLIVAAVKCFEPLTGVGFSLILIGYNKGLKKTSVAELLRETKRRSKEGGRLKNEDRKRRRLALEAGPDEEGG
ncbi:hypothetical protein LTR37_014682 [Vermiconidia calcicola]|uniref:Uncharacterized protein n=1 Tax=Vermiconidia calcicola TaxID=1690605 RepID=A0ACC3MUD5_9PEZI|nr:hypothetical protein LTR37_014682 [Vermiconidia calcicola]